MTAATNPERSARSLAGDPFAGARATDPSGPTVISLRDDLGLATASALREQLIDVLRHSSDLLILDLSDVPAADVAGLAVLIGTQRRARLAGITLLLVAPSLPVGKVLRSTGLDRSFTICPDLPAALAVGQRDPAGLVPAPVILAAAS